MVEGKVVDTEKVWLTVKDTAKYLGMTEWFARELKKKIPWYKLGKTIFFKKADVDRIIEKGKYR